MNKRLFNLIVVNFFIVFVIMFISIFATVARTSGNNKIEDESKETVYEFVIEKTDDHNIVASSANILPSETYFENKEQNILGKDWTEEEAYMLAKIAMAEAEGESLETKVLVILTILNRVKSDERYFPDTIKEVIFQKSGDVYQFSPIKEGGRWWTTEPDDECWEAVNIVSNLRNDLSDGALYFEACENESWHSRNLEFICQSSNTRFYK